ncbi:hypothetical protein DFR24_3802 [Panacagrimonas perspica]|uniref:Uncharacterized protein n=1 Tax=Panacagrimonas perspica TaxID=381431 RepID=A0A4R7P122_9GAMM|nr:hypothetical protein [Panacagrimonas perspica]TDU26771.1 hypothetical protein DFR24_3802 [Panacagrimonas perspica]THD04108.1 hypothetical protein B1810_07630 [Panacagrimonas perspica]
MRLSRSSTVVLSAALLLAASLPSAFAADADAAATPASPSTGSETDDAPTIEIFGKRRTSPITPELLQRLGGIEGAREWVGMMTDNMRLSYPLRQKLLRFQTPEQRADLDQLLLDTMLGMPLDVQKSTVEKVERLELTEEEFNMITEAVMETCDESSLSFRDCNRILASIRPVGLYARGF